MPPRVRSIADPRDRKPVAHVWAAAYRVFLPVSKIEVGGHYNRQARLGYTQVVRGQAMSLAHFHVKHHSARGQLRDGGGKVREPSRMVAPVCSWGALASLKRLFAAYRVM
jgi:hypothetical protein